MQIGAIGVSYLIAWLLARKIHQYLDKGIEKITVHMRLISIPAHFAIILRYVFWLLLVWFCQVLFKEFTIPAYLPPLNLTAGKTVMFGTIPVKLQLEINHYLQQPDAFGYEQHSVQTRSCPGFFLGDIFFLFSDTRLQ